MDLQFLQIKETCLYIKDIQATKSFYNGKLGLPIISEQEDHIFFRAGSSVLLCFIASETKKQSSLPPHFGSGHLHFAFQCRKEDYEPWKEKITGSGIAIEHEAEWRGLKSFYFRDPDSHLAEVVMEGMWG